MGSETGGLSVWVRDSCDPSVEWDQVHIQHLERVRWLDQERWRRIWGRRPGSSCL